MTPTPKTTTPGTRTGVAGRRRAGVVLSACAALVAAGCGSSSTELMTHTATVTVDGTDVGQRLDVRCTQMGWLWTIQSMQDSPGFVARVSTGGSVDARAVTLTDLGGFTGSFSDATVGQAKGHIADGVFTIDGTAVGAFQDRQAHGVDAEFTIRTRC